MATLTRRIGPNDHGQRSTLDEFIEADFEDGWLYELARGVIDVTQVPGPHHGMIVQKLSDVLTVYDLAHPGLIKYRPWGGACRLRLPGMQSDRHPDYTIYLDTSPPGPSPWTRWIPHIVAEVISRGGEDRDYV